MDNIKLADFHQRWVDLAQIVLRTKDMPSAEALELLKDSYEVLYFYHKETLVPKELCELFPAMEEFLQYTSILIGQNCTDAFYLYGVVFRVIDAMKDGFFAGDYGCAFPQLTVYDEKDKPHTFDFEKNRLEDLI